MSALFLMQTGRVRRRAPGTRRFIAVQTHVIEMRTRSRIITRRAMMSGGGYVDEEEKEEEEEKE